MNISLKSLQNMPGVRTSNGSSLSVGKQLHWIQQLSVVCTSYLLSRHWMHLWINAALRSFFQDNEAPHQN